MKKLFLIALVVAGAIAIQRQRQAAAAEQALWAEVTDTPGVTQLD